MGHMYRFSFYCFGAFYTISVSGSYWSSSIGSREASLLGTIKTNEYSWSSMCIMWLQVATLAHDFTSSQEVTCRYSLRAIASTVVPLFHSATPYDHVCESLMHPDERLRPRSRYSMHKGMVTASTRACSSRRAGAVRGVLRTPGYLLAGITGRVSGARRGPLLLAQ